MVRIKFTGPGSTVQLTRARASRDLDSTPSRMSMTPTDQTQPESDVAPKMGTQESLLSKQQQSLEMVKIMLHVSLGTLFYLREFLPLPCFDDRDLKEALRMQRFSYKEFINSNSPTGTARGDSGVAFGRGKRGQPLKIILRNSDPKADMILEALENGIFDALSKSVLEAIQLTILVDKEAPDNVLETYTFSFKYTGGLGDLPGRLESLSIEPVGYVADMKSAQTARIGLETIVRRLITLSAFLPTLPSKRTLGIHLFYTENCPPDYEPPGFTGARDGTISYPLTDTWRKETQACGVMDSGWHTQVTSLKWTGPDVEGPETLPEIPLQLEYKDTVKRTEDIGFEDGRTLLQGSITEASFQETTQDLTEREKLQMMMRPVQDTSSQDSDLVPTQPIKPITPLTNLPTTQNKPQKFRLSQDKVADIKKSLHLWTHNTTSNATDQNSTIRCECGWDGEEVAMIECDFCRMRQHSLCYGYDANDSRAPDVHACYQCLLEPNEAQVLSEMKNLVLLRRALRIILDEGFPSRTSIFSEKLHCNGPTVLEITSLLRKQNFLQPTTGYKSKGFLRRGLPKFIVPDSEDIRNQIQAEIFDPMAKIKHHYTKEPLHNSLDALGPVTINEQQPIKPNSRNLRTSNNAPEAEGPKTRNRKEVSATSSKQSQNLSNMPSRPHNNPKSFVANDDKRRNSVKYTPESLNSSTPMSTRKRTRASQNEPQVVTDDQQPTPTPGDLGEGLRRSGRKKRKISNYSKIVNVGADTSGNESG